MDVLSSALALAYESAQAGLACSSASSSDTEVCSDSTDAASEAAQTFAEIVDEITGAASDELCSTTELSDSSTETSTVTTDTETDDTSDTSSTTGTESSYSFASSDAGDPSPAAPWDVTLTTPSELPELASNVESAVAEALAAAGVDPSTCKFSYWEEFVYCPMGTWTNKSITIETADGSKMDFDATLALQSPEVTAREVKTYLLGETTTA